MNVFKRIKRKLLNKKELEALSFDADYVKSKLLQMEYELKYNSVAERLEKNKDLYQRYITKEPIFTFCMPTYNGEKYIARALESILMQETTYNYKIWIIDDCSTDNTVNIVREYEKKYPEIFEVYVNPVNERGLTVAPRIYNNIKTKYWMNFDQDDYWISKDKLERGITYFENHPECTLFSSNLFIKFSNELNAAYNGNQKSINFNFFDYPMPLGILMQTSATMYRNVFNNENLAHINSYIGTNKQHCILGDTFRNVFALSHGCGRYENSVDSVYTWTENGTWSKLNEGQQEFYNLQYFYDSIDFFDDLAHKNKIKQAAEFYCKKTQEKVEMLNEKELNEFNSIKRGLNL